MIAELVGVDGTDVGTSRLMIPMILLIGVNFGRSIISGSYGGGASLLRSPSIGVGRSGYVRSHDYT